MSKSTWGDVKKGDVVELGGRDWTVVKMKRDGKRAKVTVDHKGREAKSLVKLKDRVAVKAAAAPSKGKRGPVDDARGTMQRWATEKELREAMTQGLPPGDHTKTKPPEKATGDPWETQADRVEKKLDEILQARLIGVATDENAGYYVPPVDSSTVASHLVIFHGGIPDACDDDETRMLKAHDAQHAAALKGEGVLQTNHWHTKKRPD